MKLKSNQIETHLKKHGLKPLYFVSGDEPLQMQENTDTIRAFARAQGFNERTVFSVEAGFDWSSVSQATESLSLFASKRLLEVRLGNKSPGEAGTAVLTAFVQRPPPDTVLLLTAEKLDANQQKAKWFTLVEEHGITIQVRALDSAQLPEWITQRLIKYQLQASSEAIQLIAERSEGHLLACAQEIEKLRLLYGAGTITVDQVLEAVADSARFEMFNWVDKVIGGESAHALHQLNRLRGEGYEPVLIIWALNREIRTLCQIAFALQAGQGIEQVCKTFRIWQQRRNLILTAVKRHSLVKWQQFLKETVHIERIVKGMAKGNPWDALQRLSLQVTGIPLPLSE